MTSIFAAAMGTDFERLHPMLQRRFGIGLDSATACIGTGVMSTVRRGPWWTLPFLYLGKRRNILLAQTGRDVPFVIKNYPYRDPYGRETITFVREYQIAGQQYRWDATMVLHQGQVIDYLGTHQHLAVDLELQAEPDGSLLLTTHGQRFYERWIGFRFPMLFSGKATLRESYDDDRGCFRVDLNVRNRVFGFLFGYTGEFYCEYLPTTDAPIELKPVRHEVRT